MSYVVTVWVFKEKGLDADPGLREQVCAWLRSLDLDPELVALPLLVARHDGQYHLHATVRLLTPDGVFRVDYARNELVTEPVVIPLGPDKPELVQRQHDEWDARMRSEVDA